jgi:hypothetical protein
MIPLPLDRDAFDRTLLIGMVAGSQKSHEDAEVARSHFGIQITIDDLTTVPPQAAVLAAVVAAVRVAGVVGVVAPVVELERLTRGGPHRLRSLRDAIVAEGAQIGPVAGRALVEIVIGDATAVASRPVAILRVSWDGWIARVNAVDLAAASADPSNVLAAIAASALAVHEAFGVLSCLPGRDDGCRDLELNLWSLDDSEAAGPVLEWAPSAWWLVGLGHLGQANAWVLSWLGLPPDTEIVLQDDALLGEANHSTGVLTPPKPLPERKVRAVARALEDSGLRTRLIEQRFTGEPTNSSQRHHVALFGVDKPGPRRQISTAGFDHAIDVGIGSSPDNFDSLLLHRFPGAGSSRDIPAWQSQSGEVRIPETPAFNKLRATHGECGLIELAGTAVGASFVGLLAATVALAEAARSLHGGVVNDVVRIDLGHWRVSACRQGNTPLLPAALRLGEF